MNIYVPKRKKLLNIKSLSILELFKKGWIEQFEILRLEISFGNIIADNIITAFGNEFQHMSSLRMLSFNAPIQDRHYIHEKSKSSKEIRKNISNYAIQKRIVDLGQDILKNVEPGKRFHFEDASR